MKNIDVARAWVRGVAARTANLWTDGDVLLSYSLRIGYTTPQGVKVVIPYRAGTRWGFVSQTTSQHVGIALRCSDAREA